MPIRYERQNVYTSFTTCGLKLGTVEYNVANRLHLSFFPMDSTFSYLCQSPNPTSGASIAPSSVSPTSSCASCDASREALLSTSGRFLLLLGDFGDLGTFGLFSTGGDACMACVQYSRLPDVSSTSRPASFTDHAQFITLGSPPSKAGKVMGNTFPHRYLSESCACLSFLFCSSSDICRRIFSRRASSQARCPSMVHRASYRQNRVSQAAMQMETG